MHRNTLMAAVVFCLATAAFAADHKKNAEPQPKSTEQIEMAQEDHQGSVAYVSSRKSDCDPKPEKESGTKETRVPDGDPQASQNQVEYGGGG
jgi:opacity protein-like surface antigen